MSMEDVVQTYKGAKKTRYTTALNNIINKGEDFYIKMIQNKQDQYRQCFIKDEQLYKTRNGIQEEFSSRNISGVCSYEISLM